MMFFNDHILLRNKTMPRTIVYIEMNLHRTLPYLFMAAVYLIAISKPVLKRF
jgi:hypothetical protein